MDFQLFSGHSVNSYHYFSLYMKIFLHVHWQSLPTCIYRFRLFFQNKFLNSHHINCNVLFPIHTPIQSHNLIVFQCLYIHHHLANIIPVEDPFACDEMLRTFRQLIETFVRFHHSEISLLHIIVVHKETNYC